MRGIEIFKSVQAPIVFVAIWLLLPGGAGSTESCPRVVLQLDSCIELVGSPACDRFLDGRESDCSFAYETVRSAPTSHSRIRSETLMDFCNSANSAFQPLSSCFADTLSRSFRFPSDSLRKVPSKSGAAMREEERLWTPQELKRILGVQSETIVSGSGRAGVKKNARLAMLCSLLFPGLGQLYAGSPRKAAIAMGIETFYLGQILLNHRYAKREERIRDRYPVDSYEYYRRNVWVDEYKARTVDWIWWAGGAIFLIVVDAYVDAHLYDMEVEIEADGGRKRVECSIGMKF